MREIKFRAWQGGVMEYSPTLFKTQFKTQIAHDNKGAAYPLMQYTGREDKNGVEIYEGDIMPWEWGDGSVTNEVVIFEEGCFWLGDVAFVDIKPGACKIIGNIYENPGETPGLGPLHL